LLCMYRISHSDGNSICQCLIINRIHSKARVFCVCVCIYLSIGVNGDSSSNWIILDDISIRKDVAFFVIYLYSLVESSSSPSLSINYSSNEKAVMEFMQLCICRHCPDAELNHRSTKMQLSRLQFFFFYRFTRIQIRSTRITNVSQEF
jgi:hypothetical protein